MMPAMATTDATPERVPYDEFGLFHENASEYGLEWAGPPMVRREEVALPDGRSLSVLVWGEASPELVFVHGTAMNAHTWDTVALALGRPAIAVDLAGHGHSGWRDDLDYSPVNLAADLAVAVEQLAPEAKAIVGMSLGGMTSVALGARHPELVRKLVLVDITPSINAEKAKAVIDFVEGPQTFASFDDLLARTIEHNPTRSESSLRRGILHNAHQLDDGSWEWRYDRKGQATRGARSGEVDEERASASAAALDALWDDISSLRCPILLVRGGASPVVDDDDVAELLRRQPDATVITVPDAGHSVQGDQPIALADHLRTFV
jgi:pimeloyl-ACP methyl ester carboxylesterase